MMFGLIARRKTRINKNRPAMQEKPSSILFFDSFPTRTAPIAIPIATVRNK